MAFDYSASGLPANKKFEIAAAICKSWLDENMSMFGDHGIANFMTNQPVRAAKLIMEKCEDWSEESVILALLGPAKAMILCPSREDIEQDVRAEYEQYKQQMAEKIQELGANHPDLPKVMTDEEAEPVTQGIIDERVKMFEERDEQIRAVFGDRAVELMAAMAGGPTDAVMERDMVRIALVEGLSNMNDQIIGRQRIDRHHQVRWQHLKEHEELYAKAKGQNPGLDVLFEADLVKSRAALEALDEQAKNPTASKKGPKPPSM